MRLKKKGFGVFTFRKRVCIGEVFEFDAQAAVERIGYDSTAVLDNCILATLGRNSKWNGMPDVRACDLYRVPIRMAKVPPEARLEVQFMKYAYWGFV